MSANLLCFILVGPKNLPGDPDLIKRATENAKEIVGCAKKLLDSVEAIDVDTEALLDKIAELGGPSMDMPEEGDLEAFLELDPDKVVREFIDVWNAGAGDVNTREDPRDENRQILVAGELSWGDEPSGTGYQAMKHAEQLGVFKFFEID